MLATTDVPALAHHRIRHRRGAVAAAKASGSLPSRQRSFEHQPELWQVLLTVRASSSLIDPARVCGGTRSTNHALAEMKRPGRSEDFGFQAVRSSHDDEPPGRSEDKPRLPALAATPRACCSLLEAREAKAA